MIEHKCDNCKLQSVCKFTAPYTTDRKNLLDAGAALPLLGSETTAIIVTCKKFMPTEAAQMAEIKANAEKLKQVLAPLAELGKTAGIDKPDQGGGGQK